MLKASSFAAVPPMSPAPSLFASRLLATVGLALAAAGACAEPVIQVAAGAQLSPGVYGRVEIAKGAQGPLLPVLYPLPLLYPQPVTVLREGQPERAAPVYLHVPPGHARHWSKHCALYDACARPVLFVKSTEYQSVPRGGGARRARVDG